MKGKDRAEELRAMAQGVFRGLHEEAALLAGAEAIEAQAKPAPKVLAEAWGLIYADGKLTVVEDSIGSGPLLFETMENAETQCGPRERLVRVQIVEVTT